MKWGELPVVLRDKVTSGRDSLVIVSETVSISGEIRNDSVGLNYQIITFLRIIVRPEGRMLLSYV